MTDWKEQARNHEESANKYARMNYELEAINKELLEACKFALSELSDMTTKQFSLGADKALRERLTQAIRKSKEQSNAS